jgi:hypothetical protein
VTHHTVFGDLRQRALAVYRVRTRSSEYLVGVHELRGRKFVVVRGEPGTDREHVVVRDSDPRIGDRSLFEVPIEQWPGQVLEVAMMTSSAIEAVVVETDPQAVAAVGVDGQLQRNPWARPEGPRAAPPHVHLPPPPGMSESPRILPLGTKGTRPVDAAYERIDAARQVVVGQPAPPAEPELPYPQRHVRYAESVALLLRSIARRDRLFEDLADQRELRDRLRASLDDAVLLIEQIRRRDRR